ncbi:YqzL family protein [Pelorhabdus rhamnosifermentans]
MVIPAEVFWKVFKETGSVVAYLMYRKLRLQ